MRLDLEERAGRFLPNALGSRVKPLLRLADGILTGADESSVSQRIALIVFIIRVASAVIAFLSQVLLARWMGGFEYGVFVAVWVGIIILGTLASIGFPSATIRFVAEYRERGDDNRLRGIIAGSLGFVFLSSTAVAAAGAWLLYAMPELVTRYYVIPIYLAAICLPMLSLQGIMDSISRAYNWPKIAFLPTYIMRPLAIIAVFGIAIAGGFPPTAKVAMWSALIACWASCFFQGAVLFSKLAEEIKPGPVRIDGWVWIAVALPVFLVEGFYVLLTSIDILFVSFLMTPEDTAVYFASTKILALVHFVYFAVKAAVSHRYTAYHTTGNIDEFREFVQKTVSWTFWPSLLLGLMMVVFGKYFLMLFGPEFVVGEPLVWILAAGIVLRSSVGPAEALLVMSGRQKSCAIAYACTLFVNIVLNFSLIPVLGLHGAAIATTAALAFESAALHLAAKRKLGIHAFIIPQRSELGGAA